MTTMKQYSLQNNKRLGFSGSTVTVAVIGFIMFAILSLPSVQAFTTPLVPFGTTTTKTTIPLFPSTSTFSRQQQRLQTTNNVQSLSLMNGINNSGGGGTAIRLAKSTQLFMYNLPPSGGSGGGGGGNNNELIDIAKGVLGLALVIGFFISPLGGFVLGIFNSILLLSIVTPILLTIAFQAWQYFNTISGSCPNCSAPVTAIKTNQETGETVPTVCYNCGAILQANYDNTGIDNITGRNTVLDNDTINAEIGGLKSLFDIFGATPPPSSSTTTTTTTATTSIFEERGPSPPSPQKQQQQNRFKREQTIIDVEIEDDKPWQ